MDITCVSDLHGHYPELEGGDLLIVAGDLTALDILAQLLGFFRWIRRQRYRKKVVVGGNHDNLLDKGVPLTVLEEIECVCSYLCDSGTEFEGMKIWGSPWTRTFEGMNPHCKAFTLDTEDALAKKFELIPADVDILVTHSPPFTILDMTEDGRQVGSTALMAQHAGRLRPKLWVFGHIHDSHGTAGPYEWNNTKYVNASHMDARYAPVNTPIRVIL